MENNSLERQFPFNLDLVLRRGLGRTLLLCFFGLAMVPLALVGFISYKTTYNRLEREVRKNIRIAAEMKGRQLQVFFDGQLADADRQGRERTTVSFFSTLVSTVNQMLGAPMEPGVGSQAWRRFRVAPAGAFHLCGAGRQPCDGHLRRASSGQYPLCPDRGN
ncbi:MAG: hypothetical protein HGJ94_08545 [Desulfosarcina sp.]|nr:hypothetical protein [Desulfosarcina sp.]